MLCMHAPAVTSVRLIAQQRRGSVRCGGWEGHEPTATAYRMHKGRLFSLCQDYAKERGQHRYRPLHGGGGDKREQPTQVSAVAKSAAPFDRRRPQCNDQWPRYPHSLAWLLHRVVTDRTESRRYKFKVTGSVGPFFGRTVRSLITAENVCVCK